MTATGEKSLNQKVFELLHPDGCWHEGWIDGGDHVDLCSKCWMSKAQIDLEDDRPDYANDLNHAWECVEYLVQNKHAHCRISYADVIQCQIGIDGKIYNYVGNNPAKAICLAFVEAMKS